MNDELRRGLERQLEALAAHEGAGRRLGGWKVGLTSGRARDAMGRGFRPFGYLLADRILQSPAEMTLNELHHGSVENELCFTLAGDLRGAPERADVVAALGGVAPAFEVVEQRLPPTADAADRLADNLSQWGIVTGAFRPVDWNAFDFAGLRVTLSLDGEPVETVAADGHIDDHVDSIAALVHLLNAFDRGLRPGDRVITGSYTRQRADRPGRWTGDFGPDLGTVKLTLT